MLECSKGANGGSEWNGLFTAFLRNETEKKHTITHIHTLYYK